MKVGNIMVDKVNVKNRSRPGNLSFARAYPAMELVSKTEAVITVETMKLFLKYKPSFTLGLVNTSQ